MGHPRPLSFIFGLSKQTIQINVKKCPSSIRCRDLNSQYSDYESPTLTTRPRLLPQNGFLLPSTKVLHVHGPCRHSFCCFIFQFNCIEHLKIGCCFIQHHHHHPEAIVVRECIEVEIALNYQCNEIT